MMLMNSIKKNFLHDNVMAMSAEHLISVNGCIFTVNYKKREQDGFILNFYRVNVCLNLCPYDSHRDDVWSHEIALAPVQHPSYSS